MFESFEFENLPAPQAAVWFGLLLGLLFGVLAEISKFCIRRGLVAGPDRKQALGVWVTALAVAIIGTQVAVWSGVIDFADHRFFASEVPVVAIVIGGLLFGVGMVLTRGCVSRLTVLFGSGNLRAGLVLVVFAITAHATLKGVLAPLRTTLGDVTYTPAALGFSDLPGGGIFWALVLGAAAIWVGLRSGAAPRNLALAALIGLLVPLGWVGTGYVLYDDFDPIAMEGLSFTSPMADSLFFVIASTSIPAGFGTGLMGGVRLGALVSSLLGRRFQLASFETPAQTGRYLIGAALMGTGGVLAGGCTVGAGLAGIPTLGFAALLALAAIIAGAIATDRVLTVRPKSEGLVPAE